MKEVNFEEMMKELEEIAEELEKGNLNLEESVKRFEKGIELSKECNKYLEKTEKRISILLQKDNEIEEEKFEA